MKLWKQFKSILVEHHDPCQTGDVCLEFTGELPENPSEYLVKKIVGEHRSVRLHWLEEQVSHTLYREEISHNAWALDIGIWGPAFFGPEVARVLAEIRPEFASLIGENDTRLSAEQYLVISRVSFKKESPAEQPLYGDC